MFKAGEKVIHHRYGEGVLGVSIIQSSHPLIFIANKSNLSCTLTIEGREGIHDLYPSIYYVPQTLDMSKPEPEIGTWGYFWDEPHPCAIFSQLFEINNESPYKYRRKTAGCARRGYINFSPEIPSHIKKLMDKTNNEKS